MTQSSCGAGRVGIGMLKKTRAEFGEQDARDGVIQPSSGQFAGINQCPDVPFEDSGNHLHVNPGGESLQSRRAFISRDAVADEVENRAPIGDDEAIPS